MTDDDVIERHCANCMAYAETRRVWDPRDRVYWVCDGCRAKVEAGHAECVARNDSDPQ